MSAPIFVSKNRAMRIAQQLGTGVFGKAAQVQAITPLPPLPDTVPPVRYPCADNYTEQVNGTQTTLLLQREGSVFRFVHTQARNIYSLERMVDDKGTITRREMMPAEAEYALAHIQNYIGPQECARLASVLTQLLGHIPGSYCPDKKVLVKDDPTGAKVYNFCAYGYDFSVTSGPQLRCRLHYKDGVMNKTENRDMLSEEIVIARRVISASMTLDESGRSAALFQSMQERQYAIAPVSSQARDRLQKFASAAP